MRVLIYGEPGAVEAPDGARAAYRNPRFWNGEVEACDGALVPRAFPAIAEAYRAAGVSVAETEAAGGPPDAAEPGTGPGGGKASPGDGRPKASGRKQPR